MKKFLSLVLAMIMTMSLVTISAGATEYKDLADKDEIQYEEAVAVLNKIGIITGYDDGTFRPETELTRGAAAKIIVSLMIGSDAASALSNNTSPYPDVPSGYTFAGVISYCKTKEYISGYGDGTFRPGDTLTGFAFAKMLLGALGYSSEIERFTGYGWTNNVANIGHVAGLFDRLEFDGSAAVTRDQACQLALNTLKATTVTYGGSTIISGPNGENYVSQGTTATPRTSNNRDINANIGRKDWYGGNNKASDYLTLEFGEEHFKDLRLEHDRYDPAHDDFGRPSNEWSYKKVTIGTFPLEADYTYTTQVAHVEDTDGAKEKNLGLKNFDLVADGGYSYWTGWGNDGIGNSTYGGHTTLWLNGKEDYDYFAQSSTNTANNKKVANIADFTDNGTLVEVYVSALDADWITDVVVIQTQLMEVKKVGSDYVSLDRQDPDVAKDATQNSKPNGEPHVGYNFAAIDVNVENVKDTDEDCYDILKGLKAGDKIAVIPVTTDDGKTYEAAEVYVPETVSGAWTRVDTYGNAKVDVDNESQRSAIALTVGGTSYKIADWHKDMYDTTDKDVKATRTDITLYMDKYGNALLAKDIGSTSDFMVIGNFYQSLVNGKICTFVHGWDIGGEEIDLNLGSNLKMVNHGGTQVAYGHELGELVKYDSSSATGDADYALIHTDVHSVFYLLDDADNINTANPTFEIKANNVRLPVASQVSKDAQTNDADHFCDRDTMLAAANAAGATFGQNAVDDPNSLGMRYDYAKDVKFIYVNYNRDDAEVDSVEFKTGRQNVSNEELQKLCDAGFIYASQAALKDNEVKAVVIKQESADANLNNLLYVMDHTGYKEYDSATGRSYFGIIAAMFTADGKFENPVELVVDKDLEIGAFATYNKLADEKVDNYYHVKNFTRHNTNPSALVVDNLAAVQRVNNGGTSKSLLRLVADKNGYIYSISANGGKQYGLVADPGDDGTGADDTKHSYVMSMWRSHGDLNPADYVNVTGYIWANQAEWLNMTADRAYDDIDSVEDLTDLLKTADVQATVLLNEKPDSDGFRTAYLIIINQVKGGGTTTTNHTTIGPITFDGGVRGEDWTTDATATMKVGSSFRVTLLNGAEIDWANTQGVRYDGNNGSGTYYFVITNTPVVIPIITKKADTINVKVDGPTGDTAATVTFAYSGKTVTAKINETVTLPKGENVTVSVAPAADYTVSPTTFTATADRVVTVAKNTVPGETVIVTVAENAAASVTFTYEGKTETVAPGGSITVTKNAEVTATVDAGFHLDNDQTSYTFTAALNSTINVYKDVVPGEKVTVTIVVGEEATGAAFDVNGHTTAGPFEVEVGTTLVVPAIPSDNDTKPYRAVVGEDKNGDGIDANGYVVNADTTVYIQRGKLTAILSSHPKFDPNGPALQFIEEYPALPAAASLHSIGDMDARMVVYAMSSDWESVGFFEIELCGAVTLAEMFRNKVTQAFGFDIPATKIGENDATLEEVAAAVNKTVEEDGDITIKTNPANRGFVNVDGAAVALPAENGDLLVNVNEDADGNVTITEKEGHEGEFSIGGKPIGPDPVPVTKDTVVEETTPTKKYNVTVNFENATVKNGTTNVTSGVAFQVAEGAAVTLTITAAEGYIIDSVTGATQVEGTTDTWEIAAIGADRTVTVTTIPDTGDLPIKITSGPSMVYDKKLTDIQSDVNWTIEKVNDTRWVMKLTGTLNYIQDWTQFTGTDAENDGWFVDFGVDQSESKEVTKTELIGVRAPTSTSPSPVTGGDQPNSNGVVLRIKDKEDLTALRYIKITLKDGTTAMLNIDVSGLTLKEPVPIVVSDYTEAKVLEKKIAELQENLTVTLEGTAIKLAGTLLPVNEKWDYSSSADLCKGYFATFNVDFSGGDFTPNTAVKLNNSLTENDKAWPSESGKKDCITLRVAELDKEVGVASIMITRNNIPTIYTFDYTGLKFADLAGLAASPYTGNDDLYGKKVGALQKDVTAEVVGDTIYLAGELKPLTPYGSDFSGITDEQAGYYVAFNVDISGVANADRVKVYGPLGRSGGWNVPGPANKGVATFVLRVANTDGKIPPKSTDAHADTGTPLTVVVAKSDDTPIKTYFLNLDGLKFGPKELFKIGMPDTMYLEGLKTATGEAFLPSDFQDVEWTIDEETKTIKATGSLKLVQNWVGFSSEGPELQNGYFLGYKLTAGQNIGLDSNKAYDTWKQGVRGPAYSPGVAATAEGTNLIMQVGRKGDTQATNYKLWLVKGSGDTEETVAEYTFDLSGLTLLEDIAVPSLAAVSGQMLDQDAGLSEVEGFIEEVVEPEPIVEPEDIVDPEPVVEPEDDGEAFTDEGEVAIMDPGA